MIASTPAVTAASRSLHAVAHVHWVDRLAVSSEHENLVNDFIKDVSNRVLSSKCSSQPPVSAAAQLLCLLLGPRARAAAPCAASHPICASSSTKSSQHPPRAPSLVYLPVPPARLWGRARSSAHRTCNRAAERIKEGAATGPRPAAGGSADFPTTHEAAGGDTQAQRTWNYGMSRPAEAAASAGATATPGRCVASRCSARSRRPSFHFIHALE